MGTGWKVPLAGFVGAVLAVLTGPVATGHAAPEVAAPEVAALEVTGTSRVSVASVGTEANQDSFSLTPRISADGQFVAFVSNATNLVPEDTNGTWDVFVRDRQAGTTSRVSVASDGTQANGASPDTPAISWGGRFVAFESDASNLVPGDTNGASDVFVRDLRTGTTTLASVAYDGGPANGGSLFGVAISGDGRFVAFESFASNLVPGDTNGVRDVFVRDRWSGTTSRVSVSGDGAQANETSESVAISADGRFVAFDSLASNLVPADTNGTWDVFVRDRRADTTSRVSVATDGTQANAESVAKAVSADGRYVVFDSFASNLVPGDTNGVWDVFVRDRWAGATSRVSVSGTGAQGNGRSFDATVSPDGRYVSFSSVASNLVPDDTNGVQDVFLRDRWAGTTTRVSLADDGAQANSFSASGSVGADGKSIAFASFASNLVPDDTNGAWDVFVRDRT